MMLVISEHQTGMEVHRDIDVQDLSDQESMMSLTLETKVEMKEMDTVTTKLEDIDLKSVDEYLDLCLMENTDSDIKI
jgi:coproporphyrinogen III oxidase-like Fe-S oxidoreductase